MSVPNGKSTGTKADPSLSQSAHAKQIVEWHAALQFPDVGFLVQANLRPHDEDALYKELASSPDSLFMARTETQDVFLVIPYKYTGSVDPAMKGATRWDTVTQAGGRAGASRLWLLLDLLESEARLWAFFRMVDRVNAPIDLNPRHLT